MTDVMLMVGVGVDVSVDVGVDVCVGSGVVDVGVIIGDIDVE